MDASNPELQRIIEQQGQLIRILETLHPPIPHTPTDLYSIRQASRITGIREATLYDWIERGQVPAYGWHQTYRVSLSELMPRRKPSRPGQAPRPHGSRREKT